MGERRPKDRVAFMDKSNVFSIFLPILNHKYENETIQGEMILGQSPRPFIIVEEMHNVYGMGPSFQTRIGGSLNLKKMY